MNTATYLFAQNKVLTNATVISAQSKVIVRIGTIWAILTGLLLFLPGPGAQAQTGALVYVANLGSDDVTVISLNTDTVVGTIPVGDGPSRLVATPDGTKVYVLNSNSQNISVIKTSTQAVDTTITVGTNPKSLAITPDGTKVYVTNTGSNDISIIDTTSDTVSGTLPLSNPDGVACTPSGSEVWVGRGGGANAIQILTLPGNGVDGTISGIIGGAEWTGFLPDGSFAFVNNGCGCCGNLQKISTASDSVVSTLYHDGAGVGLAIAPDGSAVYAGTNGHCGGGGPQIKKIDPATNDPIASLLLPAEGPGGMTITPAGDFLYVPVIPLNQVFKIDTATMTTVNSISVGTTPVDATIAVVPATDTTPPTVVPQVTGTLGNNDWYTDDVTVAWTVNDEESSLSSTNGCETTLINSDTTGTTLTCEATSVGGTASQSVTIKRDATPPTVSVTGVTDGATYSLGQVPAGGCDTQDSVSGVATQATLSLSGGNANSVGSFTATCVGASDQAGHSSSAGVTYQVIYNFNGFFAPVDNPPTVNSVKAGQGIPVKFSLAGNQGLNIFDSGYPKSQGIACDLSGGVSDIEETINASNSSLAYDPNTDQYSYVWKTKKDWARSCRQFVVRLNDGTEHLANFEFK
jgi:YVTN family beta-propeller protein